MIKRGNPSVNYTKIPNSLAADRSLPFDSRGVLLYLLSKPPEWTVRMSDIEDQGGIKKDKRQRIIRELVKTGYLVAQSSRIDGKYTNVDYLVYDTPQTVLPELDKPSLVNPPIVRNKNIIKKDNNKKKEGVFEKADMTVYEIDEDDFAIWFAAFPKQKGMKKARGAYFLAAKKTDAGNLLRCAEEYAREVAGTEPKYIKEAANWLRDELWTDYDQPSKLKYIVGENEVMLTEAEAKSISTAILKRE